MDNSELESVQNATAQLITGTRCTGYQWSSASPTNWPSWGAIYKNILRQSYDYLTIIPKLRSTYDGRLIYKTSYEERKDFLRYDCKIVRSSKIVFVN